MNRLVIFDLDNTLVDRDAIFRTWAADFVRDYSRQTDADLAWLIEADQGGSAAFFSNVKTKFGLSESVEELLAFWRASFFPMFRCEESTVEALRLLRQRGFKIGIATNGSATQELKITNSGLDTLVDGWCVSDLIGHRKPDGRIFELLAERCSTSLEDAWVIGDSPEADIAGALTIGARSIWIDRGRTWPMDSYRPTLVAARAADAVALLLEREAQGLRRA